MPSRIADAPRNGMDTIREGRAVEREKPDGPIGVRVSGNSVAMSERKLLYVGCPWNTLSMYTSSVEPSNGILFGCGARTHPKFVTVPDTTWPWPGVSIVPKGAVAVAFDNTMVLEPSKTFAPSTVRCRCRA